MRTIVLAMIVGAGTLSVGSLEASAMPANGAAIALIGVQTDSVIHVRQPKVDANAKRRQVVAGDQKNQRCFGAQTRDRYGYCVPNFRR
jgi:hypothetical protein